MTSPARFVTRPENDGIKSDMQLLVGFYLDSARGAFVKRATIKSFSKGNPVGDVLGFRIRRRVTRVVRLSVEK